MARERPEVARRLHEISTSFFQHETDKLATISVPELELA
jgi:hypothetical protein